MSYIKPPRSEDLEWSEPGEFPDKSGWYPASNGSPPNPEAIRWFDAKKKTWSVFAFPEFTAKQAAENAAIRGLCPELIQWAKPWWEGKQ